MIVEIYDEEELGAPYIGVDIQTHRTRYNENFTACLMKMIQTKGFSGPDDFEDRHSSQVLTSASHTFHKGLNLIHLIPKWLLF